MVNYRMRMEEMMDILRTLLLTPGNREKLLEKTKVLPADAIILDLEDSVPPAEKEAARKMVAHYIPQVAAAGQRVYVRINSLKTPYAVKDIKAIVVKGLQGIVLPKPDSAEDIKMAGYLLGEAEADAGIEKGTVKILPIVESPEGIINVNQIARAPRVTVLNFGPEDFLREMGVGHSDDGMEIYYPRMAIAIACHAAGIMAIDGVYFDWNNKEGLIKDSMAAKKLGYQGKFVVTAGQIETVNKVFSPSAEEIAQARRIIETLEAGEREGAGITYLDGRMVDIPVADGARKVLALAEEIKKRDKRKL
ncbi:MAG: CoA ester lyase [Chloroflexota bacterium]